MKFVVRIDRIVLDGLPVEMGDRAPLEAAIRAEIAGRLSGGDAGPSAGWRARRVVADPVSAPRPGPGSVAGFGSAIGGSVHDAIVQGRTR
jgi:hypothetical protein